MSGITSTLSIAKSAIAAQQYGLNVTGNNIANVNNPDYSIQDAQHINAQPASYAGYIFGTGVDMSQIQQSVDQLLENRLTHEISNQAAMEEAESYMSIIEGIFDETSDTSLSSVINDYWNAWQDLSNNPQGTSERVQLFEKGMALTEQFNIISSDLLQVEQDLTREIGATLMQVNSLSAQIGDLNKEILGMESNQTANDLRDQRNGLVDELGQLININVIVQGDGAYLINAADGATLVNGVDSNQLIMDQDRVVWQGAGSTWDITDKITGGKLAGWLSIRDEVIPKYHAQVNELAGEMIWAVNYQHSQGAGLDYISGATTGTYSADDSGWFSSLAFGDHIDYSKDFSMWVQDTSSVETQYRQIMMDMGISQSDISNWQGTAPGADQASYRLTVVDGAVIGDKIVAQTSGDFLGEVWGTTSGNMSTALDSVMAEQTLTLTGGETGTHTIDISDTGSDARRSAASIAEELNNIDGVDAFASSTQLELELGSISRAEEGDIVQYTLYVDGIQYDQSFTVSSSAGSLEVQFEKSLEDAASAVNILNSDTDLYADDFVLKSDKGATLGVQGFEVIDNAGIKLSNFSDFNSSDEVSLTISTDGVPTTSRDVVVDLTGMGDITDQAQLASAFYNALSDALSGGPFAVDMDEATDSVIIRTTDGSNIAFNAATGDTGNDASVSLSGLAGTTTSGSGNTSLEFTSGGTDMEIFNAETNTSDMLRISMPGTGATSLAGTTVALTETGATSGTAATAAVTTGTLTIHLDPDMSLTSDNQTAAGLFGTAGTAVSGGSIITLGGNDGFDNFDPGDTISFDVDGQSISLTVSSAAGGTTQAGIARQLFDELNAGITNSNYQFVLNGSSVSILKSTGSEDSIEITNFTDSTTNDASLSVSTGTGTGTNEPENNRLESGSVYRNFATASVYGDEGIILWEKLDEDGNLTGDSGLIQVEKEGTAYINEEGAQTLSFDLSKGTLVAGNTLIINTGSDGSPDSLEFDVHRQANAVNDTYHFEVVSGGSVGHLPDKDQNTLTIQWSSSASSGTFEIQGHDPPKTPDAPVQVEVDGMLINFYDGTLFDGDVFTITTDESGSATAEQMSDWHWTLDSFADEFNRNGTGMTATVTAENKLKFESSDSYFAIENMGWSGTNGFSESNGTIAILDYTAFDFKALDMQLVRSSGTWGIVNDATGGVAQLIPPGGDDNGFKVDLNGDGIGDVQIDFSTPVTGDGSVRFDTVKKDPADINYAFGGMEEGDCGLSAALGINTFFVGEDASDMDMNEILRDTKRVNAGLIDSDTGVISEGENNNALALSGLQHQTLTLTQWDFARGQEASASLVKTSLDDYYNAMIGSLGVTSRSVTTSREFADIMVSQITEQRDAVSAVSLDEEMIKLMKYQHAYTAASKLLTAADEMLQTLLSIK